MIWILAWDSLLLWQKESSQRSLVIKDTDTLYLCSTAYSYLAKSVGLLFLIICHVDDQCLYDRDVPSIWKWYVILSDINQ